MIAPAGFLLNKVRLLGWLAVTIVALLFAWTLIEDRLEKAELRAQIADLRSRVARLTAETRRARVLVESIKTDAAGINHTVLLWAETDEAGKLLPGDTLRRLQVRGSDVHFDSRQIIFSSEDTAAGDPLRGRALTLFTRIWGDQQSPESGAALEVGDASNPVPARFRSGSASLRDAEDRLWRRFQSYCTDQAAAEEDGVRTAQGTAVHKTLLAGREYRISVSAPGQVLLDGPFDPDPFVFRPGH
ncbi:MAG: hypothetical protein EXS14_07220 [Planctomycetes bacterium]|nr:hypothetical protein [Planctomycetota bacterium]